MLQAVPSSEPYTHKQVMGVVFGVVLCVLLAALDQTVVIPAVPTMAAELNGFNHLSWIVTAYLLTSTASAPILGKLSDLWGRRPAIIGALTLFILASMLCACAQSVAQLISFRALQGIGGGGLISLAQTAVADVVSPRDRARYQPYLVSMWAIASTAGPVFGGWVTQHASWRYAFWINLPVGAIALYLCYRGLALLPRKQAAGKVDAIGVLLMTAAVSLLLVVVSGDDMKRWISRPSLLMLAASLLLIAGLAWYEKRAGDPLLPPRLFANKQCIGSILVAALASVHNMAAAFLLPLYFQLALGEAPGRSGVMVMPNLIAITLASYASSQVVRRIGRLKSLLLAGTVMSAASFAVMSLLLPSQGLAPFLLASIVLGCGLGLTFATLMVWVQNTSDPRDIGVALGTQLLLRSMGGAFGAAVSGALLLGYFNRTINLGGLPSVRLEDLRHGSAVMAQLSGQNRAMVLSGVTAGFHAAFIMCLVLAIAAIALSLRLTDLPLRTKAALHDVLE